MKYKLLKDLPKLNKGHVFNKEDNNYVNNDTSMKHICCVQEVEDNLDWFAPYLFTTEDGVDIYTGDYYFTVFSQSFTDAYGDFIEANKVYGENIAHCDKTGFVDYVKLFSTKQAAEKYLEPNFKVGDIVVFKPTFKIGKIVSMLKDERYCVTTLFESAVTIDKLRLATNEEIIKYYRDLGWVEGAKFKCGGDYDTVNRLMFSDNVLGVLFETTREWKELYACELIKYPKIFEDLKEVHGYAIGENKIFKDFEYCNNYSSHKIFNTSKQAESALAFAKLSQLVAKINGDWVADWSDKDQIKHVVVRRGTELSWGAYNRTYDPLPFKSAELRNFSFEHHKELWNKYYQL